MLSSLTVLMQVLPPYELHNEIAEILDVDNSYPDDEGEDFDGPYVRDIVEVKEDKFAAYYDDDSIAKGRATSANKVSKKGPDGPQSGPKR